MGTDYARRKSASELDDVLPQFGFRHDAEPRAARQLELSIDAAHARFHETQIGVEYRMLMLVKRNLGQACGTRETRRMKNADSYRRMRNDVLALRGGELADGHELRQPGMRAPGLTEADTGVREPRLDLKDRAPFFPAGDCYTDIGGDV